MATFRERQDPMRLMWRRLLAVALLILLLIAVRGVWGVYKKSQESRVLKIEAQAQLGELQQREQELRTDIASLKSDRGVEAELRERYDLAKEGEGVVVIVEPPSSGTELTPTPFQKFKTWLAW